MVSAGRCRDAKRYIVLAFRPRVAGPEAFDVDFALLRELTEASGVPGNEDRLRDTARREFGGIDDEHRTGGWTTWWELSGVIGSPPPHTQDGGDVPDIGDVCINLGLPAETVSVQVSAGDPVTMHQSTTTVGKHDCTP